MYNGFVDKGLREFIRGSIFSLVSDLVIEVWWTASRKKIGSGFLPAVSLVDRSLGQQEVWRDVRSADGWPKQAFRAAVRRFMHPLGL